MRVLRYKSAKYSIERPLHVGAALAGAAPGDARGADAASGCRSARRSSSATTCSGSSATPRSTGKPAGDDLTEGKRTVLVALALDACAGRRTPKRLDEALGTALSATRSPTCAGSSTSPVRTPRWSGGIEELTTESLAALEAAPVTDRPRARAPRARGRRHPAHPLTESGGGVA